MTQQPDHEIEQVRLDPDALPRPEEEVADAARGRGEPEDPQRQPVAGGTDDGEPAQGSGTPDSW